MRWIRITVLCTLTLALGLSCGDEFSGPAPDLGFSVEDGRVDGTTGGGLELVTGQVSTLSGPQVKTSNLIEGKPDYSIDDDGLEYLAVQGEQCSADDAMCITEGGIVP